MAKTTSGLESNPEIAKLLGIIQQDETEATPSVESNPVDATAPVNLPTAETAAVLPPITATPDFDPNLGNPLPLSELDSLAPATDNKSRSVVVTRAWGILKLIGPYLLVFVIGLALYYFYFSSVDFDKLTQNVPSLTIEKVTDNVKTSDGEVLDDTYVALQSSESANYQTWIKQFFFSVNDASIIDMNADVSGNGLTNFQKYLLDLNPKVYSTRGDQADGLYVIKGQNPWTAKSFTAEQLKLIDTYFNRESISNRLSAGRASSFYAPVPLLSPSDPRGFGQSTGVTYGQTSATPSTNSGQSTAPSSPVSPAPVSSPPTGSRTPTSGRTPTATSSGSQVVSTSGGALRDEVQINPNIPGELRIPGQNPVPIIWSKTIAGLDNDLKKGVVHYPGTPFPGQIGTAYISGHSSGYRNDNSPYKTVFAKLGSVPDGGSFTIIATTTSGKKVTLDYVIQRRQEYQADDQAQFISTADSVVALSTCWPVGTLDRRLVLFAKLSQISQN